MSHVCLSSKRSLWTASSRVNVLLVLFTWLIGFEFSTEALAQSDQHVGSTEPSPQARETYERYLAEKNKISLRGWKGVMFYCSKEDAQNNIGSEVCRRTEQNVKFLSATAKIDVAFGRNWVDVFIRSHQEGRIILTVNLIGTRKGGNYHLDIAATIG